MTRHDDDNLTPVCCLSLAQLRAEVDRTAASVVDYLVDQERRSHYATADGAASVRRHLELLDELTRRTREELPSDPDCEELTSARDPEELPSAPGAPAVGGQAPSRR